MIGHVGRHPSKGFEAIIIRCLGRWKGKKNLRAEATDLRGQRLTKLFLQTLAFIKQTTQSLDVMCLEGDR